MATLTLTEIVVPVNLQHAYSARAVDEEFSRIENTYSGNNMLLLRAATPKC